MVTLDEIKECHDKIPETFFNYAKNFVFLDFEVFKNDWLVCFSVDGIHIKNIVNDAKKLKDLILNKLNNRVLVAYNGNNYDKYIMLALLNDINPKEVNDNLINNFNFNFNNTYGNQITFGTDLMWYDPSSRLGGSLKTYEACEGENIYESEVSFDLDRKLTQAEIDETLRYCSFDVEMLVKFFYKVNFDSFLGHIGLIEQTIVARPYMEFYRALPKTDASLVGTYLCTDKGIDTTKDTDTITIPENIILGKYEDQIKKFLEIPIKTLKNGTYNGLNAWCLKLIDKSINRAKDTTLLDKLKNKEEKSLEKIKKHKLDLQKLKAKSTLTEKQKINLQTLPEKILLEKNNLLSLREDIHKEEIFLNELQSLVDELNTMEEDLSNCNYNYILSKIIEKADVSQNNKKLVLIDYLHQSNEELFNVRYLIDKKETLFDSIMIQYPFEVKLDIKGVPHLFKTGGIHSVYGKSMTFDKRTEHDKDRILVIADVGSLYPNLMRVFNLCSIGMDDPKQFAQMIFDRIKLKKKGDPFANVLKLILNTTYGCMGSVYNNLYDPTNRLKVCIFGQAAIVDLLDKLEDQIPDLEIFQSNTDGIVISCLESEYDLMESIIHEWENRTGLEMEIDKCKYLQQKDVSNYILVFENDKPKFKGSDVGKKNAFNNSLGILNKALRNYFIEGKSIYDTINENQNLIDYQIIKKRSGKTKYMNKNEHLLLPDKVLRLFPVTKNGINIVTDTYKKVPEVPECSLLVKENILNMTIKDIPNFDINYYVNAFNDKLEQWLKGTEYNSDENEMNGTYDIT